MEREDSARTGPDASFVLDLSSNDAHGRHF